MSNDKCIHNFARCISLEATHDEFRWKKYEYENNKFLCMYMHSDPEKMKEALRPFQKQEEDIARLEDEIEDLKAKLKAHK
jgi:hypothetical protein